MFRCDTAAELESARRNAYYIKDNCPRADGARYNISTSHKAMVVTVTVVPAKEESEVGDE